MNKTTNAVTRIADVRSRQRVEDDVDGRDVFTGHYQGGLVHCWLSPEPLTCAEALRVSDALATIVADMIEEGVE